MRRSEALREAVRARVVPASPRSEALSVAQAVARSGGEGVLGIVFFGSRKTHAGPDPWSAYDLFVLTRDYLGFYRSLRAAGALRREPALAAALNAVLPPNQVAVPVPPAGDGAPRRAKCAVISLDAFLRETSPRRRDHFCIGRLFQPTELLHARDEETRERIVDALVAAHLETYAWVRPWLPPRFDADAYTRALLRVSLSREIRPEPGGRADALWEAQQPYLREVYAVLLRELAAEGELTEHADGSYALAREVTLGERLRVEAYFRWSLVRATARWFKYILTFEDWLEYILRKAQRHTGQDIVLTPRERRLPVIFLWPRLIRYLRQKDKQGRSA